MSIATAKSSLVNLIPLTTKLNNLPLAHPVFPNLPAGLKIKGGNIVFRAADLVLGGNSLTVGAWWSAMWGGELNEPSSGAIGYNFTWIKRQIDNCKTNGGNTVRIMGDVSALKRNALAGGTSANVGLNLASFLTNLGQVLSYCQSQGIFVYYTLTPSQQMAAMTYPTGLTAATNDMVKYAGPVVQFLLNYPCVIAVDMCQELSAWRLGTGGGSGFTPPAGSGIYQQLTMNDAQMTTFCQWTYQGLKVLAPNLPMTFSGCQPSFDTATVFTPTYITANSLLPYMDYIDVHLYGSGGYTMAVYDPNLMAPYLDGTTKTWIVGETGRNADGTRGQHLAVIRQLLERPDCSGLCVWTLTDQNTVANDQWGLFNASNVARTLSGAQNGLSQPDLFKTLPERYTNSKMVLTPGANITAIAGDAGAKTDIFATPNYQCAWIGVLSFAHKASVRLQYQYDNAAGQVVSGTLNITTSGVGVTPDEQLQSVTGTTVTVWQIYHNIYLRTGVNESITPAFANSGAGAMTVVAAKTKMTIEFQPA